MQAAVRVPSPPRWRRLVPIVDWSRQYDRSWLRGDVLAGIAVAAMIVPKNLGYAGIAGIPVENGLYAAAAAAIIYALFCTSRHISTGPSSSLAAVAGGAVLLTGLTGAESAQLVAAIAIATGALFLLVAVLRLGWLASFLSRAVVTGFLAGAAIDVVIGELPKLTGTSSDGVNAWEEAASWFRGLGDLSPATLGVGLVALVVILGLRFLRPRVPGALVLVVGGLIASFVLDLGARGVALVGPVPRGLPLPVVPSIELVASNLPTIGIAAFALVLIGFSQTAGDAQAFATRHRYRVDLNQESVAQGMANLGAGVFQGMPVSTSLSASSLNESAGARTPVASLATGLIVVATLILLAPLFSQLPKAVLAAIIIDAVVFGMIDVAEFRRLRRVKRFDFWIAVAAAVGVLSVGVLLGVVVGIVLSLLWLIHVATRPSMPLLGREPGTHVYRDLDENPDDETYPGVAVIRIDGGLFFATAAPLDERVRAILDSQPRLHTLVLDLEGVNFVDSQGAAKLGEIDELAGANDVELRLARLKPNVADVLAADGVIDRIGRARIHGNVHRAVERAREADARRRADAPTTES
jgi:SulP family sulfate permease